MSRRGLSRRTLLRGALGGGAIATVGLPLLDAMTNLGGTAHADGTDFPHRFAIWFWGNGTHPGGWAPATTGTGWQATGLLRGLAGLESKVHVISGTTLPILRRNNTHVEGATGILTGGNPIIDPAYTGSGGDWNYMTVPGPSIDQVIAQRIGATRFQSLILAVTPLHGINGPGTAVRYLSHSGPYAYNAPTYEPVDLFNSLFGPSPPDPLRASVLDAVLEEANSLSSRLGARDQVRLSQHMDSIRDLELRVRTGAPVLSCTLPAAPPTTASYRERARLFSELIAMAFTCDLTRVAAMEFSSPASHSGYPDIFSSALLSTNGSPTSFHEYEHQWGYDSTVLTGLEYFHDVFSDFLHEMDAVPEGGGTVLDHSLVLGTSEVAGGAAHTFDDFPLFLAGGANGRLGPGAHHLMTGALSSRVLLTAVRAIEPTYGTWGLDQFATTEAVEDVFA